MHTLLTYRKWRSEEETRGEGNNTTLRSATMMCYFMYTNDQDLASSIDLRPWMDQTPITLHANSNLQLAVSMFQKLGLRYLLLLDRGSIKGLLTKKDIWWILNVNEIHKTSPAQFVPGAGVLRNHEATELSDGHSEAEGLLQDNG